MKTELLCCCYLGLLPLAFLMAWALCKAAGRADELMGLK